MKTSYLLRFSVILLLVLLTLSMVMNGLLFNYARQYYLDLNAVRLDPLGLDNDVMTVPDSTKTAVVFFGDSRAARWPALSGLTRFEFINRGIEAQTSAQVLQRFDYQIKPLRPRVIVVQVGVNDLKTIPLFPDRKTAIVAACEDNIRQIAARGSEIGSIVVLTTIFPVGEVPLERRLFWSPDISVAVVEVNTYIHSLAKSGVIVFDAYSLLSDNGVLQRQYAEDELHLSTLGYKTLNDQLALALSNIQ